ncbi:MAG: hypothetical protein V7L31_24410 [Nostoc sp.]|uniref:hypothetical protein n=1 Tax=Nostoc sp. TaxID=1180 RepID=UPI002FEEE823
MHSVGAARRRHRLQGMGTPLHIDYEPIPLIPSTLAQHVADKRCANASMHLLELSQAIAFFL